MSQLNDISLVAQVVVFKNTRAFDILPTGIWDKPFLDMIARENMRYS